MPMIVDYNRILEIFNNEKINVNINYDHTVKFNGQANL